MMTPTPAAIALALMALTRGTGGAPAEANGGPKTGTAVSELVATLTKDPASFVVAAIALEQCGDESGRCIAMARRVFRASRVVARAVKRSGTRGFAAFVRRQQNVVAAVFRCIAIARAEWALRNPNAGRSRSSFRALREGEKLLDVALISGRLPRRLPPGLAFLKRFVVRKVAGAADDALALGSGNVPVTDSKAGGAARPAESTEGAARTRSPDGKRDIDALPNFLWRKSELDARDTDKVPLKRIIAELRGIAEIVNRGVPIGGGVSIRPDKVEGHWGIRIMGVFAEEEDDAVDQASPR
ncbi:MAG: hypothetical protein HYY84_08640 [Deltaproteobacteria bacterium]|nr:hypothetical protein [Deltaproteobacteria bacterium]